MDLIFYSFFRKSWFCNNKTIIKEIQSTILHSSNIQTQGDNFSVGHRNLVVNLTLPMGNNTKNGMTL